MQVKVFRQFMRDVPVLLCNIHASHYGYDRADVSRGGRDVIEGGTTTLADKASNRDLYITDTLAARPVRKADPEAEKQALKALITCMAERPADVLPQLVALAMKLTRGTSAGLSLYEEEPAPGVFRWRHLHGILAPFENSLTPRNDSPCGVTLDQNRPVLSSHPEHFYDWIAAVNVAIPEVLLVPLYIDGDEPLGTLWIVAETEGAFDSGDAAAARELADFAGTALRMIRNEERLRASLDEQEILAREMSHRLKNLLAMTDALIFGSAREATSVAEMGESLSGRLHALADAHSMVQRNVRDISDRPRSAELADLIRVVVKVHDLPEGEASRFSIDGPSLSCGGHAINAIALVIHELTTNAAKYGALNSRRGRVAIQWRIEGDRLVLSWTESGGPKVPNAPERSGFGTRLIERTVERQLRGTAVYDWRRTGLAVTISVPVKRLSA